MMEERKSLREILAVVLIAATVIAVMLVLPGLKRRMRKGFAVWIPLTATAEAAEINAWKEAVLKVKEERGEPIGKQAKVSIPPELGHYSDTRRFLAIQVAEWREHQLETPADFVGLAALLKKGELVGLKPVTDDYILLGVGGQADREPFTYYDRASGKRIALYSPAELTTEQARITDSLKSLGEELAALKQEQKTVSRRERAKAAQLGAQITRKEKELRAEEESKELIDATYGDPQTRGKLLADYEALESFARNFAGRSYDLADGDSRQALKIRMLSALRPEALKVLEEIAASYKEKFDRPLPVTSLVRPEEYQHMLHNVNPNATLIETPPHSTGLAFDIYYHFMTAEEQSHVMQQLAQLEDEGRIEVLRENRDHYHVFAFVDGKRPDETFITESLGRTAPAVKSLKEPARAERPSPKEERRSEKSKAVNREAKRAHTARGKRR